MFSALLKCGNLRALLSPRIYSLPLVRSISRTMVQGRNYGPQVLVRRLATRGSKPRPIFNQVAKQVVAMRAVDLRLPSRAWKVKLVGEGADDAGGVFDDTITDMCLELTSGEVNLLIPTPNAKNDSGSNGDRFLLNPNYKSLSEFKFLGELVGDCVLDFNLMGFRYFIGCCGANEKAAGCATSAYYMEIASG